MVNKIFIDINGQTYTFNEVVEKFNVKPAALRYRYKKGYRGQKLIQPNIANSTYIDLPGEKLTIPQFSKKYGFKVETVRARIKRGIKGKDLLLTKEELKKRRGVKININGEMMSVRDIVKRFNLSKTLVENRIKQGMTADQIIQPPYRAKQVQMNGKRYTFAELSMLSKIGVGTIVARYRRGWRDIDLIAPIRKTKNEKVIIFKGKHRTYNQLAQIYNLPPNIISNRYLAGWRDDKLVQPLLTNKSSNFKGDRSNQAVRVLYHNKWVTLHELANITGIKVGTVKARYRRGWRNEKLYKRIKR